MKLSMIVIGENEAATLPDICKNFKKLDADLEGELEFVFVDSDSSDGSLSIISNFKEDNPDLNIKSIRISGDINAAIARNIGIKHKNSDSEYIFFLDGDIVFENEFIFEAISLLKKNSGIGTVTGKIYDCYENYGSSDFVRQGGESKNINHHGGNFMTKKEVINSVGYFDEALTKHQDIDYTFRIREKGYLLRRSRMLLGHHFTTNYLNFRRVCNDLKNKKYISTGILFRKYFFSNFRKDLFCSGSVKAMAIRLALLCSILFSFVVPKALFISIPCVFLFVIRSNKKRGESYLGRFISILNCLQFVVGVFRYSHKQTYKKYDISKE